MLWEGKRWSAYLCPKRESSGRDCKKRYYYLSSALTGPGTAIEAKTFLHRWKESYNFKEIALLRYTLFWRRH